MKFNVGPSASLRKNYHHDATSVLSSDCSFWSINYTSNNNIRFQVQYLNYGYKYFTILLHNYVFMAVYKSSQGNQGMDALTGNVVHTRLIL